ncbi:MAG: hypothetical protein AAFP03_12300 [Cyanobacteria bacterium J06598_3]
MTDDELRALVAQNSQEIAGTRQSLNALIQDVIKPMAEGTVAFREQATEMARRTDEMARRTDEMARRTDELETRSEQNEQRSIDNATLFRNLLAEAREDRINNQKRFEAQQEVIRALLLRMTSLNEDIADEL